MNKFLPLIVFIILISFLYASLNTDTKTLPSALIDRPFPNIEVQDFTTDSKYFIKERLKNNVTLVNIWASWCVSCRAEHQMLTNIAANSKDIQLLGINYKDDKKDANKFLNTLGDPYNLIVFDPAGTLAIELGVYAIPETFLVDKNGIIRFKHVGIITPQIWQQKILPLINDIIEKA